MTDRLLKLSIVVEGLLAIIFCLWLNQVSGLKLSVFETLLWPAIALHQLEEYVLSDLILGKPYYFRTWVYTVGYDVSVHRAFVVNVAGSVPLAFVATLLATYAPHLLLLAMSIEAVNGMWHLGMTLGQVKWSPGTASSVFVYLPLTFALFHQCLNQGQVSSFELFVIFILATVLHWLFFKTIPRVVAN